MGYIFISYSHKDKDYTHKLYQYLFEHGFDSWIDDRVNYGSRWSREVERRIRECVAFILIMSPNSFESQWVENEVHLARRLEKTIYVLLLEGEVWWDFSSTQYIDVTNKEFPPAKFLISLRDIISQSEKATNSNVSIKVEGNLQGNIIVGDNNYAQIASNIIEADKKVHEQAELDRKAREKIEADKKVHEQAELDRKAREKVEADKKVREQAELDRKAREKVEADKKVRRQPVADRNAHERIGVVTKHYGNWEFETRQVIYGVIGAILYGILSWLTNIFPLPAVGNVTFRPAVAVLIFFGAAYGPWVGFLAGFFGNTLGDALSGWGFYWNWSLGNALMGLVAGQVMVAIKDFRAQGDIAKAVSYGLAGIAVGMLFASLTEIFTGGIDFNTALFGYFVPAFLGSAIVTIVLLPILMIAFAGVAARRGR